MHIGDYDNEASSFAEMKKFMDNNGLVRSTDEHREIYCPMLLKSKEAN
jgi:hypothetical protein